MQHPRAAASGHPSEDGHSIDGPTLARALIAAADALGAQADAINAINVFPVPDGDTGTNMWMTMRAAADAVPTGPDASAATVAKAAAQGALMGAKGNSGVILSQILAGFAAMPDAAATLDASAIAGALERARDAAYHVVSQPREGTILTAISAAATAARDCQGDRADETLAAAVEAAHEAVARTPELLPILKEAGVVDSGAQGLYVMLDGMLRGVRGESTRTSHDNLGAIDTSWLAATKQAHAHGETSGFCTEFVVSGSQLNADAVRERLRALGDSLLVVGGPELLRVHLHTHAPDQALAYARSLGGVSREKVDDMSAQFAALAAREEPVRAPASASMAAVAVVAGTGLEALFESMGAAVVRGGQTMNPSAGEIRRAIEATRSSGVIVLPNNKNILLAARQAAEGLAQDVRVVETRSVPQGVAALVAMNTEATLDENATTMTSAIVTVRSAEVTRAARATALNGLTVREGDPIGIVDGELTVCADSVDEAVRACVQQMLDGREGALVTLYVGESVDDASASALAAMLHVDFDVEVEILRGDQPNYPYLIGVE